MLPNRTQWTMEDDFISYTGDYGTVHFDRTIPVKSPTKTEVLQPTKPVILVNSLRHPQWLPEPSHLNKPSLLMMLQPQVRPDKTHYKAGEECWCIDSPYQNSAHRVSVLSDVCLRKKFFPCDSLALSPVSKEWVENPAHFYIPRENGNAHHLALPAPFLQGGKWPNLPFRPTLASGMGKGRACSSFKRLYLSLYDQKRARQVASTYQNPPEAWRPEDHP